VALTVWRIVAARFAARAFDGEGARRYGGRWNPRGISVVYSASTLSLAALETLVQVDADLAPLDHVSIPAEIPEDLAIRTLIPADLPSNWRDYPAPERLKNLGAEWIHAQESAVLIVPSVVVPREHVVLLNPHHPEFPKLRLGTPEPFVFDPRLRR
jgi:RES domain-containing protein